MTVLSCVNVLELLGFSPYASPPLRVLQECLHLSGSGRTTLLCLDLPSRHQVLISGGQELFEKNLLILCGTQ